MVLRRFMENPYLSVPGRKLFIVRAEMATGLVAGTATDPASSELSGCAALTATWRSATDMGRWALSR